MLSHQGATLAESQPVVLRLDHLYRLTDNVGIYQHAKLSRPDPAFGYCIDDNARALIAAIRAHRLTGDNSLLDYVRHYLSFVERCQRPDGRFHNFMASDGTWLDEVGSEDSQGRTIWALGVAAQHSPQIEVRVRALKILDQALPALWGLREPRGLAFSLLGLREWRQAEPATQIDELAVAFADGLVESYRRCAGSGWYWFEDVVTYCNARLPQALMDTQWQSQGMESLAWLCEQMHPRGWTSLVGNRGWYPRGGSKADHDQQAIDACATVSACVSAYRCSGDDRFRQWARSCFDW